MTRPSLLAESSGARRAHQFDPVAEGARFQLSSETALALWHYVTRQLARYGSRNEELDQQCFCEAAARLAARTGQLDAEWLPAPDADAQR